MSINQTPPRWKRSRRRSPGRRRPERPAHQTGRRPRIRIGTGSLVSFRAVAAAGLVVIAAFGAVGCGRFYSAELAGYVKDEENGAGVNGAVIRMYLREPDTADASGFIVETASMSAGGNAGYYSHRIIWQNLTPKFGEEGDSGDVWIGITHEDYAPRIAHVRGILSDTVNTVPDILITRATFSVPLVSGRVVNAAGTGVNGVRVVLDLQSTTDDDEDYVAATTTIDGETGSFRIANVTWRDSAPDGTGFDTEPADIFVSDDSYESTAVTATLTSDQDLNLPEPFVATRKSRTEFSTTITGRCFTRYEFTDEIRDVPVQGVEVTVSYQTNDGTSRTLYAQTGANGAFSVFLTWVDDDPGDFDGPTDLSADPSIPDGEDGLFVEITYSGDFAGSDITGATSGPGTYSDDDFIVKSWLDPNYVPEAIYAP